MPTYLGTANLEVKGSSYSDLLYGHWKFDNNFLDFSGRGFNGTSTGSPTFSTTVPSVSFPDSHSLSLALASNFLTFSDSFDPLEYTVSLWIRPSTTTNQNIWLRTDSTGANNSWASQLRITAGKLEHYAYTTTSTIYQAFGLTSLSPSTWYHVAIVFNPTVNRIYVYLNGVEDSGGGTATTGFPWAGGDRWQLGGNANALVSSYPGFVGLVDDVRYYNRAFGPREIAILASGNNFGSYLPQATSTNRTIHNGTANLSKSAVIKSSAIFTKLTFSGSANLSVTHPVLNARATFIPRYNGRAVLSKHPNLLAAGYATILQRAGLNLFIKGGGSSVLDDTLPLYISGSTLPEIYSKAVGQLDLFMPSPPAFSQSLNLFVEGVSYLASLDSSLNLFLKADYPTITKGLDLFLMNETVTLSKNLRLYIKGAGLNAGYSSTKSSLNLFVEGTGSGPLYEPVYNEAGINLFIKGGIAPVYIYNKAMNLFIKGSADNLLEDNITLFIEGLNPGLANASLNLVIPKVHLEDFVNLYIHGF